MIELLCIVPRDVSNTLLQVRAGKSYPNIFQAYHPYLPTYLPTCLPAYLHTYLPTYLPTCTYLPTYRPTYLPNLT